MDDQMLQLVRDALVLTLKISAPILIAGIVVGLAISLLQSVTSVQDQTLSFVPKIVVMIAAVIILIPWIGSRLVEYAAALLRLTP